MRWSAHTATEDDAHRNRPEIRTEKRKRRAIRRSAMCSPRALPVFSGVLSSSVRCHLRVTLKMYPPPSPPPQSSLTRGRTPLVQRAKPITFAFSLGCYLAPSRILRNSLTIARQIFTPQKKTNFLIVSKLRRTREGALDNIRKSTQKQ